MTPDVQPILVAACGNLLAGDDAFGPLVAEALARQAPRGVDVIDLGMRPAALLDHLPGRKAVILVDAAILPDAAGRAAEKADKFIDIDFFAAQRPLLCSDRATSTHGLALADQLELARQLDMLPPIVRLLALVVESPVMGTYGRIARESVPAALDRIQRRIRELTARAGD